MIYRKPTWFLKPTWFSETCMNFRKPAWLFETCMNFRKPTWFLEIPLDFQTTACFLENAHYLMIFRNPHDFQKKSALFLETCLNVRKPARFLETLWFLENQHDIFEVTISIILYYIIFIYKIKFYMRAVLNVRLQIISFWKSSMDLSGLMEYGSFL